MHHVAAGAKSGLRPTAQNRGSGWPRAGQGHRPDGSPGPATPRPQLPRRLRKTCGGALPATGTWLPGCPRSRGRNGSGWRAPGTRPPCRVAAAARGPGAVTAPDPGAGGSRRRPPPLTSASGCEPARPAQHCWAFRRLHRAGPAHRRAGRPTDQPGPAHHAGSAPPAWEPRSHPQAHGAPCALPLRTLQTRVGTTPAHPGHTPECHSCVH